MYYCATLNEKNSLDKIYSIFFPCIKWESIYVSANNEGKYGRGKLKWDLTVFDLCLGRKLFYGIYACFTANSCKEGRKIRCVGGNEDDYSKKPS